jgi:flagellar hook-basal body complex protein FliE
VRSRRKYTTQNPKSYNVDENEPTIVPAEKLRFTEVLARSGKKQRVREEMTAQRAVNEFLQVTKEDINDWTTKAQMELEVTLPTKKNWNGKSDEQMSQKRKVQSITEALDGFLNIERNRVSNTVYLHKRTHGDDLLAASESIVKQKKAEEGPSTTQPKQIHRTPPAKEDLTTKLKDINDDLIKTVKQKDIFTEGQKDELEDAIDALFQSKNKTTPYATKKFGLNLDDETAHEIENHLNRPRISFEADEDVLVEHINIQLAKAPPESRFTFRPSSCLQEEKFILALKVLDKCRELELTPDELRDIYHGELARVLPKLDKPVPPNEIFTDCRRIQNAGMPKKMTIDLVVQHYVQLRAIDSILELFESIKTFQLQPSFFTLASSIRICAAFGHNATAIEKIFFPYLKDLSEPDYVQLFQVVTLDVLKKNEIIKPDHVLYPLYEKWGAVALKPVDSAEWLAKRKQRLLIHFEHFLKQLKHYNLLLDERTEDRGYVPEQYQELDYDLK